MWDFSISQSLGVLLKTIPFILLRFMVYASITSILIIAVGIGAGVGWSVGSLFGKDGQSMGAFLGGFMGLSLLSGIIYWLREYILYLVKAGHIAVMVSLITGQAIPSGRSQLSHAQAVVRQRFVQASTLFALDQLIKGVLVSLVNGLQRLLNHLPLPNMKGIMEVIKAFLRVAVGFIDEVILGYVIYHNSDSAWQAGQDALVLYGQNYKIMLKNALWLMVIIYTLSFMVFLLMLIPSAVLVYLLPNSLTIMTLIFALLLAWSVKVILFDPFAVACLMQVYFKTIDGQTPSLVWEQKLHGVSEPFRQLQSKV
ncbi:hypothetical protein [Psychrobacter sp. I-STPA6b]|uniref:hypothetical protein n=1 Tax=Psychrobacter sp. I-STPA6b TaxID=2585718 RepID=UPI001D0C39B0|nr:hypothetical protein [Psychrobacter sp. I-STPA6b]